MQCTAANCKPQSSGTSLGLARVAVMRRCAGREGCPPKSQALVFVLVLLLPQDLCETPNGAEIMRLHISPHVSAPSPLEQPQQAKCEAGSSGPLDLLPLLLQPSFSARVQRSASLNSGRLPTALSYPITHQPNTDLFPLVRQPARNSMVRSAVACFLYREARGAKMGVWVSSSIKRFQSVYARTMIRHAMGVWP